MNNSEIFQGELQTNPRITAAVGTNDDLENSNGSGLSVSGPAKNSGPVAPEVPSVKVGGLFDWDLDDIFDFLDFDKDTTWKEFLDGIKDFFDDVDKITDAYRDLKDLAGDTEAGRYYLQFAPDGIDETLKILTNSDELDKFLSEHDDFDWQVSFDDVNWTEVEKIVSDLGDAFFPEGNGKPDVFFCTPRKESFWDSSYFARHDGNLGGWTGTGEIVSLAGKNIIDKIVQGTSDLNALLLNDNDSGDALFLDDLFSSESGSSPRLAFINEIQAGAGDDVIDLTSQRYIYLSKMDALVIKGGDGNDTIWANSGTHIICGDLGNDRIIGGSGNDTIVGGAGNDTMHGGGGSDIFTFGSNWGNDTVEQLASGSVTLWFEFGSKENWNTETLTYSDGINSVVVKGTDNITLQFGNVGSLPEFAFDDYSSRKVYDKDNILNMLV